MGTHYVSKWQAAADDVLAVLLTEPTAWEQAIDYGLTVDDFPEGAWRKVYHAVIELRAEQTVNPGPAVLSDVLVAARAGAGVAVEWVSDRIALYDEYRAANFDVACALLRDTYGIGHRRLNVLTTGAGKLRLALESGGDIDEVTDSVAEGLQFEQKPEIVPVDIADIGAIEELRFENPPAAGLKTGVWLIDDWVRGIAPGEFVAWVAPYKSRKTSVLANVLLNVALDGKRVDFFSYDESRTRVYFRFMAVLMARFMWENKYWNLHSEDGAPLNVVDAKMLINAGNRWRHWPEPLRRAREYARDTLSGLKGRLRVYDRQAAPATLQAIRSRCVVDAMKMGGLDLVAVDHIQRISVGRNDTTYDRVEMGSSGLHELGGELNAIMWVLSQQNEAAIRSGGSGGDWTPNAKGGGGIASNADTVFVSTYKQGSGEDDPRNTDPRFLRIDLKLAREAEAPASGYVEIHPASGWITPNRDTIQRINLGMPIGENNLNVAPIETKRQNGLDIPF